MLANKEMNDDGQLVGCFELLEWWFRNSTQWHQITRFRSLGDLTEHKSGIRAP
jgi:hypothetical protein